MTPEEAATLQNLGTSLRRTFAAIVFESILYTLYGLSVVKACRILREKTHSLTLIIHFTIIIIFFLCSTVLFAIDISNFAREIATSLIHNPELPIDERYATATQSVLRLAAVEDALYAYMTILGDAVIIWRVHVLWKYGRRRWWLIVLWGLLFGSVVTNVFLTYCVARLGTDIVDGAFQKPVFCKSIQTASYAMPVATTIVATIMIGLSTWKVADFDCEKREANYRNREYQRSGGPGLRMLTPITRIEKIMMMLIESGVLYSLFFLSLVICNTPSISATIDQTDSLTFANLVFAFSTSIIVGWYPTIVIILAHSRHSMLDSVTVIESTGNRLPVTENPKPRAVNISAGFEMSVQSVNEGEQEGKPRAL